ncbi:hypothetical protein Nepgr_031603 [Nepenthes gracilis]|uniref:Protein kinase domain-containing protein n=1 Tax=Nepenthes gracilis TaxID=150966 RepID=A0AAD3Y701_NEPGR|nr:hypothetical protein Nepgr_031603 [Nepenthes gracilis]
MDEGDAENLTEISASEGAPIQGKESEVLVKAESCNALESQEMITPGEGSYPRSSIHEFMDLLDGKNASSSICFGDTLECLCTHSMETSEGRVQELILTSYNSLLGTTNSGKMMESVQNQLWTVNKLAGEAEAGSSHGHAISKAKGQPTSGFHGDEKEPSFMEFLAGQPSDHECNTVTGQLPYSGSVKDVIYDGVMRPKIISKTGLPKYFLRSTLKGKGVLWRGPTLGASGFGSRVESVMKDANAIFVSSDAPLNVEAKHILPSLCEPSSYANLDSCTNGDSLREWLKSVRNELHKVSSWSIFRQILELVDSFHSRGTALLDLRPSCFRLLPLKEVKYCGRLSIQVEVHKSVVHKGTPIERNLKKPLDQGMLTSYTMCAKRQKISENFSFFRKKPLFEFGYGLNPNLANDIGVNVAGPGASGYGFIEESHSNVDFKTFGSSSCSHLPNTADQCLLSVADQLEEQWYRSPEELIGKGCTFSSNVYSLGVLLFELLSCFDTGKSHAAAMSDLSHRILPPKFLSENPKEAGFCLWLLHPEPSFRPTTRDILQSEVIGEFLKFCGDDLSSIHQGETESEILLHFLTSMKEQKQKHASKLEEDIRFIEDDIQEVEKRHLLKKSLISSFSHDSSFKSGDVLSELVSDKSDLRLPRNIDHLESAYFSVRSNIHLSEDAAAARRDWDLLKNRENYFVVQKDEEKQKSFDRVGAFFDGLCKYARYSKLEVCGSLRNRDLTNSANVICSLSFDRDEDYFAAAGVSKKIKIFEFQALYNDTVDIHYPAIEMTNKSKISCVCWNNYIRNYLASTDYDGVVKLWDARTGQGFFEYTEHEKRAWSVDFSRFDPTKLASGSDDCSVKLWSINESESLNTIRNIANVCCIQFSSHSSYLLAFGSADYKIYCYDLRNANVPWCILSGHEKAVSYVKFLDSETLVSASTDSTIKLWDLNKSSSAGLSTNACSLTLRGHTNEKNFVGLSVADGYIACGSETNEVYTYYKSFPMPITSHKFGSIDPISGKEIDDHNGQFVSSVCWRGKSNVIVAANSSGHVKVLRMV